MHECVIINTSNIELNVTQKHQQKNPKDFDVPRVKKNAYEKGLRPKQFKYNQNKIIQKTTLELNLRWFVF